MNLKQALTLFAVILAGALLANLIALKIAADQASGTISANPLFAALGKLTK